MALPFKQLGEHFSTDHLLTRTLVGILNRKDILNKRVSHLTKDKAGQRKKNSTQIKDEGEKKTVILLYP